MGIFQAPSKRIVAYNVLRGSHTYIVLVFYIFAFDLNHVSSCVLLSWCIYSLAFFAKW